MAEFEGKTAFAPFAPLRDPYISCKHCANLEIHQPESLPVFLPRGIISRKGAMDAKVTLAIKTLTTWENLLMEIF